MKKLEREAIQLTQECLRSFWQNQDADFVLSHLAEDIVWIGAQKYEFLVGREETERDLRKAIKQVPPCVILNAEFFSSGSINGFCTVSARYVISTSASADYFLQGQQRCTFVWKKTTQGMQICHIHVSNPMGELKLAEGEVVPATMGKLAQNYLQNQVKRLTDRRRLNVFGGSGSMHSIPFTKIMYVSAFGKDAIIICEDAEILAKSGIAEIEKSSKDILIPVHRSYLVNPDYITSIERYAITLLNGSKIPIPKKKYNEIRDILLHCYDTTENSEER